MTEQHIPSAWTGRRKARILSVLHTSQRWSLASVIALAVDQSPRMVRQHLNQLESTNEVQHAWITHKGLQRLVWAAPGVPLTDEIALEPPPPTPEDPVPVTQALMPVGAWRLDHAIPARSVFEIAEAA